MKENHKYDFIMVFKYCQDEFVKTSRSGFKWFQAVLNLLFPKNCQFCSGDRREGGEYLCHTCFNDIGLIHAPIFFVCGVPLDISYDFPQDVYLWGV